MTSEEKNLEHFFENLPFIKFSDLDKIHINHRGLLKKDFSRKKILNICSETAKIANFHFSHYKSVETISCHNNHSSYPIGTKNIIIHSPAKNAICEIWKESVSEEMLFENVDGQRMPAYIISSPMSLWLR